MATTPPPPPGSPPPPPFTPPPPPPGAIPPPGFGAPPPPPGYGVVPPPPGYSYGATGPQPEKAGFWTRVGSSLLDSILYGLLAAVFIVPAIILGISAFDECVSFDDEIYCPDGSPKAGLLAAGIALGVIGIIVVAVIYFRALGRTGQTWGRKITNIKVVGKDDLAPIGVGRAFGRYIIQSVFGIIPFLPLLDVLWMLWDEDKQTLHDKVVNSVVIRV